MWRRGSLQCCTFNLPKPHLLPGTTLWTWISVCRKAVAPASLFALYELYPSSYYPFRQEPVAFFCYCQARKSSSGEPGSVGLMVGLSDLEHPLQPLWFNEFVRSIMYWEEKGEVCIFTQLVSNKGWSLCPGYVRAELQGALGSQICSCL